jgi:16S rRNA (cytosine967-C5)-methyltransferase
MMRNKGKVLAIDIHEKKLKLIRDNSRRLGLTIVEPREADASKLKLHHSADRVLLDAPCSGLGVLGRKADVRWAKDEKVIAELCELQAALLNNAATLVRPGGRLVYSTCTVESDENERIVETFLSAHKKFRIVPPPENAPKELFSKEGFLRTWPHRHEIAGGFAAVLERIGE